MAETANDPINDFLVAHNRRIAGDPPEGVASPTPATLDELLGQLNDNDNAALRHMKAERARQFDPTRTHLPREY
jgi:hypothetical protein